MADTETLRGIIPIPETVKMPRAGDPYEAAESYALGEFWRQAAERGCTVRELPKLTWNRATPREVRVEGRVELPVREASHG